MESVLTRRLDIGRVNITVGVQKKIAGETERRYLANCLMRHTSGDYGIVDDSQREKNEQAADDGGPVKSSYSFPQGTNQQVVVITQPMNESGVRECTTILLAEEAEKSKV